MLRDRTSQNMRFIRTRLRVFIFGPWQSHFGMVSLLDFGVHMLSYHLKRSLKLSDYLAQRPCDFRKPLWAQYYQRHKKNNKEFGQREIKHSALVYHMTVYYYS